MKRQLTDGQVAFRLLYDALVNGGCTYDLDYHEEPTSGYVVSFDGLGLTMTVDDADIRKLLNWLRDVRRKGWRYVGSWRDGNILYFDVNGIVHDIVDARKLAVANRQIAFYHLDTGETHYVY